MDQAACPIISEVSLLAASRNDSPAWLAWGLGPQSMDDAKLAFAFGHKLATIPGLTELIDAYVGASAINRETLLRVARTIKTGTAYSEPVITTPAKAARQVSLALQPTQRQAAKDMARELNRKLRSTLAESEDFDLFDRVSRLLVEISATPDRKRRPNRNHESPDVGGARTVDDAIGAMLSDKT